MDSKLYVGNVSFKSSEEDLKILFGNYGEVQSVKIITDRETGKSRGFGFVEMGDTDAASSAIEALNGKEAQGRTLKISIAQDKKRSVAPRTWEPQEGRR